MDDDITGDGSFQGIVTPCQMCLGGGELVTLQGRPDMVLRTGGCPQCDGTGYLRIACDRDEVDDIVRRLPPGRVQVAVRHALADAGLCSVCYGCGVLAAIDCDEDQVPVGYLEAPCPACQDQAPA